MNQPWTAADIPDQSGKTAVVTGANTGLGLQTALRLAAKGASVVLACRDRAKAQEAADRIESQYPEARTAVCVLDLGSLDSVAEAAAQIRARHAELHLLINNAGVMMPPATQTRDGFELQFGTNHLGHFALTGRLLDQLLATNGSRIVTVSSKAHQWGRIDFDDLHWARRRYRRMASYGQSKVANLLFAYELQRRLTEAGAATLSLAAHPGTSSTELVRHSPRLVRAAVNSVRAGFVQDAAMGALPILRAATDPDAEGGAYFGPDGRGEFTGHPVRVASNAHSHDTATAHRLWTESERLTGVTYRIGPPG